MKRFLPILILFFFTIISSCNKDEIDRLEKRNIELQEQISNLTIEINSLTSDLSNLSSSNNDLLNQITNLQYIINELEEDLNNMTNDYEQAELENSDLYDEFLSIVNSRNELQAQLDNIVDEISSMSCPLIELSSSDMANEQMFCTGQRISPLKFLYDETIYSLSFIQDSIPSGISIVNVNGTVTVDGFVFSGVKDLFSFDLKFEFL